MNHKKRSNELTNLITSAGLEVLIDTHNELPPSATVVVQGIKIYPLKD